MNSKNLTKNRLRDKTCDTCYYNIRNFCRAQNEAALLPEENTCKDWEKIPEVYKLSNIDAENELMKSVVDEFDQMIISKIRQNNF